MPEAHHHAAAAIVAGRKKWAQEPNPERALGKSTAGSQSYREAEMNWLQTIVLAVLLVGAALYLLFGAVFIVTAIVERRPVTFLVPAGSDDPERQKLGQVDERRGSPEAGAPPPNVRHATGKSLYAEPRILAAVRRGFTAPRLFKHQKGGIYKTYYVLMVSPSEQILALVRWGTTGGISNKATVLYSALDEGEYLVTSDRPIGVTTPEFEDELVFLDADFDQLVGRHEERMRAAGEEFRPFSRENPLAEFNAFLANRAKFLVANGDAYWVDAEQTAGRSTISGALKAYARSFSTSRVDRSLLRKDR